jgi:WG containing repeat
MKDQKTRVELLKMYDEVSAFHEGLACARKGGKWCHIRLDGTPAYEQRYDAIFRFSEGFANVRMGTKWLVLRLDPVEVKS